MDVHVRRQRALHLRGVYPFAAEVLSTYLAVLDVWETVARHRPPKPQGLATWAAEHTLPEVLLAVQLSAPQVLATATRELANTDGAHEVLTAWLAGQELTPVESFLARACLQPALETLQEEADIACSGDPAPRGGRRCPRCGGRPQLSVRTVGGDPLVRGDRQLCCARCAHRWSYSATACPFCGESAGAKRTVFAERNEGLVVSRDGRAGLFPHLRIDACTTCRRYLIEVDRGRDARAVPEVDELAALPLDLYAAEQGLSKVTPNLMGF